VLNALTNSVGRWLRGGPKGDVAISSRVRLARNVAGYPFLSRADPEQVARIEETLRTSIMSAGLRGELTYLRLDTMDLLDRQVLAERHLTAREHAEGSWVRGLAFGAGEELSLMVNEEDHLREQVIYGGLNLEGAWQEVRRVDDALADRVPFAFSAKYGYLTACPTNVGTGMRASVMCHLPGLVIAGEMERVVALSQSAELTLRGRYGEGTHASADLYQVSNRVALGVTEEDILQRVSGGVEDLITLEREARQDLFTQHQDRLRERLALALELLGSAGAVSSEEALHFLSQVRLGIAMGLVGEVPQEAVDELLLLTLPAHLQTIEGRKLESKERNQLRANYIQKRLGLN